MYLIALCAGDDHEFIRFMIFCSTSDGFRCYMFNIFNRLFHPSLDNVSVCSSWFSVDPFYTTDKIKWHVKQPTYVSMLSA